MDFNLITKIILYLCQMKIILCLFGCHKFKYSLSDLIDEFGYVPLENVMPSNTKCERCEILYKDKK